MSHIYVTSSGATVGIKGGRIIVSNKDGSIHSIPKETVESISIFGNSHLSTPCIQFVLQSGISVSYFSGKGRYFGRLESTMTHKNDAIKYQLKALENEKFVLDISKKIIMAKIKNQEVLLRRYIKNFNSDRERDIDLMNAFIKKCKDATSLETLLGYEGVAAKLYFDCISKFIHPDFKFKGRNKRPPKDPFNSLISLGYTLLIYEIYAKIESEGLIPYYGMIHKHYSGNPALASDLIEEWRSVIVDSVVLSMIQGNELDIEQFTFDEESKGVFLSKEAMNKFIKKFERKMSSNSKYLKYNNKEYSFRGAVNEQCRRIKESFTYEDESLYIPVVIR